MGCGSEAETPVVYANTDPGRAGCALRRDRRGHPGARLIVVPECGRLSALERSEAVNRAPIRWMQQ
jgi:hypothetical protein